MIRMIGVCVIAHGIAFIFLLDYQDSFQGNDLRENSEPLEWRVEINSRNLFPRKQTIHSIWIINLFFIIAPMGRYPAAWVRVWARVLRAPVVRLCYIPTSRGVPIVCAL